MAVAIKSVLHQMVYPEVREHCLGRDYEIWPKLFSKGRAIQMIMKGNEEPIQYVEQAIQFNCQEKPPPKKAGQAFSNESTGSPWKIPRALPNAKKINNLLERSMAIQMDSLADTEFKECFMSGDSLAVNGMIHVFLKCMGIQSEFNTGILKVGDSALPMVWLTVHGTLIDNTNFHWSGSRPRKFDTRMLDLKRADMYLEEDPTETSLPLLSEVGSRTSVTDPKMMKAFATPKNILKYFYFRMFFPQAYPHFNFYNHRMCQMGPTIIRDDEMPGKHVSWLTDHCWGCEVQSSDLKKCKTCHVAKYCNGECLQADWEQHKLMHEDLKANTLFHHSKAIRGSRKTRLEAKIGETKSNSTICKDSPELCVEPKIYYTRYGECQLYELEDNRIARAVDVNALKKDEEKKVIFG